MNWLYFLVIYLKTMVYQDKDGILRLFPAPIAISSSHCKKNCACQGKQSRHRNQAQVTEFPAMVLEVLTYSKKDLIFFAVSF